MSKEHEKALAIFEEFANQLTSESDILRYVSFVRNKFKEWCESPKPYETRFCVVFDKFGTSICTLPDDESAELIVNALNAYEPKQSDDKYKYPNPPEHLAD